MKRTIIIAITLVLVIFSFAACKKPESKKEAQVQQAQKEEKKQAEIKPEAQTKQKQQSTTPSAKEETKEKPVEIKESLLTEKEQREYKGGLEGELSYKEALSSLKILVKGDYKTIRWYQEWGKEYGFKDKDIQWRYENDICAAVKKIALVKTFPAIKAKASNKPPPPLNYQDEFVLILTVIEEKTSIPKAVACAAEAIGWYQDKKAIQVLNELIKNNDPEIRLQSAGSLLILDEGDTSLPVLDELAKAGIHQSTFALEKLFAWEIKKEYGANPVISHSKLWNERGKEILVKALNYSSDEVKAYAAASLAEIGGVRELVENASIKILKKLENKKEKDYKTKEDRNSDYRAGYHASVALERIKSIKGINVLKQLIKSNDDSLLKRRAEEALNNIQQNSRNLR